MLALRLTELIQQIPAPFTVGVLVGLVLGIASKAAVRVLLYAVAALVVVELVRSALLMP